MVRFRIGVCLLLALLVLALGAQLGMAAAQKPVEQALKQALSAAQAGDFSAAQGALHRAWEHWDSARTLSAMLADHAFLEDVEANFAMLSLWAQEQERGDFCSLCAATILRLGAISAAHRLSLASFF